MQGAFKGAESAAAFVCRLPAPAQHPLLLLLRPETGPCQHLPLQPALAATAGAADGALLLPAGQGVPLLLPPLLPRAIPPR